MDRLLETHPPDALRVANLALEHMAADEAELRDSQVADLGEAESYRFLFLSALRLLGETLRQLDRERASHRRVREELRRYTRATIREAPE